MATLREFGVWIGETAAEVNEAAYGAWNWLLDANLSGVWNWFLDADLSVFDPIGVALLVLALPGLSALAIWNWRHGEHFFHPAIERSFLRWWRRCRAAR